MVTFTNENPEYVLFACWNTQALAFLQDDGRFASLKEKYLSSLFFAVSGFSNLYLACLAAPSRV